jgi:hypothetical protein
MELSDFLQRILPMSDLRPAAPNQSSPNTIAGFIRRHHITPG